MAEFRNTGFAHNWAQERQESAISRGIRTARRSVAICLCCIAFAACGQERPRLVLPPAHLAECAEEPLAPELPAREEQLKRDLMVFDYILAMRSAYSDCRSKVDGLKAWMEVAK